MEVIYINEYGEKLTLRQRKPYFLQRIEGAGTVSQTVTTFKAPRQDGAFFISGSLEMRNITLEGTVVSDTADSAYNARKHLLRVFTPKLKGTLIYRDVQIACIVEEAGFLAGISERTPTFFISLLCPSPFFEALHELRAELAAWLRKFSFPLEIPSTGIEFGARQLSQIVEVENMGDVPCGCTISFRALGTVTNPSLTNVDTGEVMRLVRTMAPNEELRVETHFANKRVTRISGTAEYNAFSYIDTDSAFIQLMPGKNTLRYGADTNIDLLEVTVFYRPLFLGI